jgi:hypothetical protein
VTTYTHVMIVVSYSVETPFVEMAIH